MSELRRRLFRRDPALWPEGSSARELLGFLDVPGRLEASAKDLVSWAESVDQGHVVLLGTARTALAPAALAAARQGPAGGRQLTVLDTTEPASIAEVDLSDAFVVVSSGPDLALESRALLAYLWERAPKGARYAVIAGPGSRLAAEAQDKGFARVFSDPPDVAERYSALSYSGMVPAALLGYDPAELCGLAMEADRDEAVELGRAIGEAARGGQDKLTVVVAEPFRRFAAWVEQLVAGSTGKQGRGCVPVPTTEKEEGPCRYLLEVRLAQPADLGPAFFRFELATAVAAHVLGVDPFVEPDVADAASRIERLLDAGPLGTADAALAEEVPAFLDEAVGPEDYVSVQAYLPCGLDDELEALRRKLRDRLGGAATTASFGPRVLHATGQLHKGGPNSVVVLQVVPRSELLELEAPGLPYGFGTLLQAQAQGDHLSLVARGRRVLRVAADSPDELFEALG